MIVNVAALSINNVVVISSNEVQLTLVELLWVNLIMDTLGTMVLATMQPAYNPFDLPPNQKKEFLISNINIAIS